MRERRKSSGKMEPSDEGEAAPSIVFLSSSDDEEANEDLSLAIVKKARQREAKRKWSEDALGPGPVSAGSPAHVIEISSSSSPQSSGEAELAPDPTPATSAGALMSPMEETKNMQKKLKKRRRKKKKKHLEENDVLQVGTLVEEEKPSGPPESVITEVNETSDNLVFRKLLRGPRYFYHWENNVGACFNCGEEGHTAANCTMAKRQRPCFVCGLFGHNGKQCLQGQDCFVCKRRGHHAKDCPYKNKKVAQCSEICLRCGETGHVMLSCRNDYSPDDLKEMQCYVCRKYGHLCCVNFTDTGPREFFCYNCAKPGHTGLGCAKPRGDSVAVDSLAVCCICHEEGHFARGCTKRTKSSRKMGESSTPFNKNRRSRGSKSVPRDFGKEQKKKSLVYEERRNMTASKLKTRGGWIVNDPGDLPKKKFRANNYSSGFSGHSSSFHTPKRWKSYTGTPNSHATGKALRGESSS
ncbi:Zinc knuckle [Musa troglodytarum]|uniref:Zinc knuckle n=1 Tax=Musa troglodytarum TaxID=320322 RepID=A0A9E7GFJ2_9LILI|nr:Zinc knuckle [Musa troglodytarum]